MEKSGTIFQYFPQVTAGMQEVEQRIYPRMDILGQCRELIAEKQLPGCG